MSLLADFKAYWEASTLQALLPAPYLGIAPSEVEPPFAVLTPVAAVVQPTTGSPYLLETTLQIHVYCYSAEQAVSLSEQICVYLYFATIGATEMTCEPGSISFQAEEDGAYRAIVELLIRQNKAVGTA